MKRPMFAWPLTSGALLVSLLAAITLVAVVVGVPAGSGQTSSQLASKLQARAVIGMQRVRREAAAGPTQPTNSSSGGVSRKKKEPKRSKPAGGKAALAECLAAHNKWRRLHKVPELEWDDKLAAFAQKRSNHIAASDGKEFGHPPDLPFGENLFWHSSLETGCDYMIKGWYDEIDLYDFKAPTFAPATGHFTQLVWRGTQKVGCAFATSSGPRGGLYLTCNYDPPGNWVGEFDDNVPRPKSEVAAPSGARAASAPTSKPSTTIAPPTTTTTTARPATTTSVATTTTVKPSAGEATTKPKSKRKKSKKKNKKTDKKKAGDKKKNKKKNKSKKKKTNSSSTTPKPSTTPSNTTEPISS